MEVVMSKWLEQHEAKLDGLREEGKKNRKILIGILVVITAFYWGMAIRSEMFTEACPVLIVITVVIWGVTLLGINVNNKKGDPHLHKQLEKILKTPEDVEEFDNAVLNEPLHKLILKDKKSEVRMTEHFIISCNLASPAPILHSYSVIEVDRIGKVEVKKVVRLRRWWDRTYYIECYDYQKGFVGSIMADNKQDYRNIKQALINVYPKFKKWLVV